MAKDKDVFGFEELNKSLQKLQKDYPNKADALLMATGRAAQRITKVNTPKFEGKIPPSKAGKIKPGQLKRSWTLKKVKLYKGGTVRVVRIQSTAPHAHLIEEGHEIYSAPKKVGKVNKYNALGRKVKGIKHYGRTEGKHMLEKSMAETRRSFERGAEKLLDNLIKSEGLDT